ncbi:cytochrome P450 [Amycolatopsis sp. CA-230715]|uniref:cytochrome P450 n=1 Tax=Amycolatopsis sp. CA-230715 TaxID=2745196 RepID=UPI001C01E58E|nr:cytochrome P450 [Amycolatopsis sp. CA-230715]QWF77917.1 Biotin biosynthesis cytochrome P450 [Amycolatopsis sp. CA-230715]
MLLVAGHETTGNLLSNGLLALLRHPGELGRLRADPGLASAAVEEALRVDAPVQLVGRVAKEAHTVAGMELPARAWVVLLAGAANRDPARFPDPDRFTLDRANAPHLAFSLGPHSWLSGSSPTPADGRSAPGPVRETPGSGLPCFDHVPG